MLAAIRRASSLVCRLGQHLALIKINVRWHEPLLHSFQTGA
jgi:hypothetical protein